MSDAMDKIAAHFSAQKQKVIPVPEWGLDIYVKPQDPTVKQAMAKKVARFALGNEQAVATIIELALNDDGTQMFDIGDKPRLLRKANPDMLAGLAASMLNAYFVDIAVAKDVDEAGKD